MIFLYHFKENYLTLQAQSNSNLTDNVFLERQMTANSEKEETKRQLLSKVFDGIREKENSPGGHHHDSDRNIYYLKQVLDIDPLCEMAWYQLYCEYLYGKYDHQNAVEVLENVYSLDPHGKRILSKLVCHYTYADRQSDKAKKYIDQLLTYHANDPEVQRLLATISRYKP